MYAFYINIVLMISHNNASVLKSGFMYWTVLDQCIKASLNYTYLIILEASF